MSMAAASVPVRRRVTRREIAYALAIALPLLSSYTAGHVSFLKNFPLALQWLAMALVATLGGLAPALLDVCIANVARFYQLYPGPYTPAILQAELVRAIVIVSGALIIGFMVRQRIRSESALGVALGELQERTDALVESLSSSKCASWVLDLDVNETGHWYEGSYPVFGRPFSEVEAMPNLEPLLHPDDRARVAAILQKAKQSDEPYFSEHRCIWPDGEVHWLEMRGTRIPGRGCRWRGVTLDITDRKLSEAALLRSEKLAAMGRLASTVAHEINNPLEAVTNLLYLAGGDETMDATTRSYVLMAERELARLGNITRLTLGFVRNNNDTVDVDMAESVEDVLSILQHRFEASEVTIKRRYEPGIRISIPPHELRQIATNLIANASDAVTGKGPDATVAIQIERVGDSAVLSVEDNGAGIPAANVSRIFDPFFSTKNEVGTGIGLWVTKEIVEKNGGHISVESGDLPSGFRTSFRLEFPLAPRRAANSPQLSN